MPHGVCSCELLAGNAGSQTLLLPQSQHTLILPAEHSLEPIRNVQSQLLPPFLLGIFMGGEALAQVV